jgi:hypothetical protein
MSNPRRNWRRTIPSARFCQVLALNIDNKELNDEEFRNFVRKQLNIVQFTDLRYIRERPEGQE